MKPDPDYIKRLLIAFQDAPEPTTNIRELEQQGIPYEEPRFRFHLRLLDDQGFVERDDRDPGFGLVGDSSWSVVPLRLTASGHEFAEAMSHSKAFAAVKSSLVTSSLSIMRDIAVAAFKMELSRHGVVLAL
jgi:repressor of nif and glnA expression